MKPYKKFSRFFQSSFITLMGDDTNLTKLLKKILSNSHKVGTAKTNETIKNTTIKNIQTSILFNNVSFHKILPHSQQKRFILIHAQYFESNHVK